MLPISSFPSNKINTLIISWFPFLCIESLNNTQGPYTYRNKMSTLMVLNQREYCFLLTFSFLTMNSADRKKGYRDLCNRFKTKSRWRVECVFMVLNNSNISTLYLLYGYLIFKFFFFLLKIIRCSKTFFSNIKLERQ